MKRESSRLLLLLFLGTAFAFVGCEENTGTSTKTGDNKDTVQVSTSGTFLLDGEIFSIPSPVQTAMLLKKEAVTFNNDILNPVENRGKYVTEAQKAINLGVYGADLAYISCFSNAQLSRTYFDAVGKLSAEIGVLDNIDKKLAERFINNVENGDSLLALNADFYRAGDKYLKNNSNTKTAVLILLGGWAESLHLAIQSSGSNAAIRQRIGEQKDAAASLAKLIGSMEDSSLDGLKKSLAELSVSFANLKSTYEYKQPIVDAQEHKTYLTSRTIIEMNDSQLADIATLVSQLRTNIIQ
jgi:hypothetical protein